MSKRIIRANAFVLALLMTLAPLMLTGCSSSGITFDITPASKTFMDGEAAAFYVTIKNTTATAAEFRVFMFWRGDMIREEHPEFIDGYHLGSLRYSEYIRDWIVEANTELTFAISFKKRDDPEFQSSLKYGEQARLNVILNAQTAQGLTQVVKESAPITYVEKK